MLKLKKIRAEIFTVFPSSSIFQNQCLHEFVQSCHGDKIYPCLVGIARIKPRKSENAHYYLEYVEKESNEALHKAYVRLFDHVSLIVM